MNYKNQKMAVILGLLGLIPFIAPVVLIPILSQSFIQELLLIQIIYASIIMCFMGGVQWGYAVAMGRVAPPLLYVVSIAPSLLIMAFLAFNEFFNIYGFVIHFIVGCVLLIQAIIDHFIIAETWFVKLRWVLALTATTSLMVGGYMMA